MNNSKLLKILISVNIFLILSLVLLVVVSLEKEKKTIPSQVLGNQEYLKEEVNTQKEIPKEFTVSVCAQSNCVWIPSTGLVSEGYIDENGIYQKVLDIVLPFFEEKYGGKGIAKNRAGSFIYWNEDLIPNLTDIYSKVYEAFKQEKDTKVEILIEDLPSTDGMYSNRYIEIDNSKQKLYAWVDGKVQKEILLSAAKDGYEVYGVFPIVDKGVAPISPSGSYMPYWMAFYYSPKQDSWYGLHSLIWWYDDSGKKVYEPNSNIGIRRSRGCIRMVLEDAKYLYDIYQKGDPILIHE